MKTFIMLVCVLGMFAGGCTMKNEKEARKEQTEDNALILEGVKSLQAKDPVKAVQLFEKAIAINPENAAAYFFAGNVYLRAKRYDDAVRVLAPGLKHVPNNGAIPFMLAIALKQAGYPKQAYLAAKRAEEIHEAWQQTEPLKQTRLLMAQLSREIQVMEKGEERIK